MMCENIFIFVSLNIGEMAEWSNALVLKTSVQQCTGGSNPSLSAKEKSYQMTGLFLFLQILIIKKASTREAL